MGKIGNTKYSPRSDIICLEGKRGTIADIICLEGNGARPSHKGNGWSVGGVRDIGHLLYQDTIGSLCATDYKWVQQEQVMQGKLIIEVYENIQSD